MASTVFFKVKGISEPVSEDVFKLAIRESSEDGEELLPGNSPRLTVLGNPEASRARSTLSRALHKLARRNGTFGQEGIDQQHRLDMGMPDFSPKKKVELVYPGGVKPDASGVLDPSSPSDVAPNDMTGWKVVYRAGVDLSKIPAHIHESDGTKHKMIIHSLTDGVGVAYCHHLKVQYFLTSKD